MKTPQSCALLHAQDIYHPGKNRLVSFSAAVPLIVFSILLFSGVESSATSFDDSALRDSTLIRVTRYSGMIGFFGQFAGPEYVAANVNIFLLPGLSLNAGGGLGAHIGANIYVAKKPGSIRLCPYLGDTGDSCKKTQCGWLRVIDWSRIRYDYRWPDGPCWL